MSESTDQVLTLPIAVPGEWKRAPLRDVVEFVADGDWIESKDQGGSDFRLLQISNIGTGSFVETGNFRYITEDTFERLRCTEILPGDVLVARMPEPTGRAWFVSQLESRCITAVDVAIVRPLPGRVDGRFLSYFLNTPVNLSRVDGLATGTTRRRVRRADLARLEVPVPPLEEQRAIAGVLGALDDKIESNRRIARIAQELADAIFASAAEASRPLGDVAVVVMGSSPPGSTYNEVGRGLPFYQGVADFDFRFPRLRVYCDEPVRIADDGDALVSVRAPVGRLNRAQYRCCIGRGLAAVRSGTPRALFYALRAAGDVWAPYNAEGTVFGAIKGADMQAVRIPWPADEDLTTCERDLAVVDDRLSVALREIDALISLRDALLPELLSGRLRVPDAEEMAASA